MVTNQTPKPPRKPKDPTMDSVSVEATLGRANWYMRFSARPGSTLYKADRSSSRSRRAESTAPLSGSPDQRCARPSRRQGYNRPQTRAQRTIRRRSRQVQVDVSQLQIGDETSLCRKVGSGRPLLTCEESGRSHAHADRVTRHSSPDCATTKSAWDDHCAL
jgi:hypothetical protein